MGASITRALLAFLLVFLSAFQVLAAAPTATTTAATAITTSSASLNGAGVPGGEQTTGWFRLSAVNPGTCDDVFGTRVPASGGTDLGSGVASVPYSITATGLSPGVTYYFCAIVQNGSATAVGGVLNFTVPSAPAVITSGTTGVTSAAATLDGSANPGAATTTGWFRYSTVDPGTCNDTFGTRAPTSGGSSLGSGTTQVSYSRAISSLAPGTTYYFCAIASNTYGTTFGAVLTFTTLANAPIVTTSAATLLTGTTAQLNGSGNPGGASATGWFRYSTVSPGTCNDSFGTRLPASGGSALGSTNTAVAYALGVTGLLPATTYYFCAIASNVVATGFGAVLSFTTPQPPQLTTTAASSLTNTTATLNGSGNPGGSSTTGYFRYATTNPVVCDDIFGSRAPVSGGSSLGSGSSSVSFAQAITGLSPGTTYYFCAIATNSEGLGFGAVLSFTTPTVPTTTTTPATLVTSTSVTLNGSSNPNGNAAFGFYRYSTVNPGVCDNVFGTRAPTSTASDTSLGAGSTDVAFSRSVTGLTPATTYYYCALGRNTYGTTNGVLMSFTTLANAPTVTTSAATLLTGTTAQLNGSANPGGDTTTGWFRYHTASPGTCNDSFGTRAPLAGGSALGAGNSSLTYLQGITGLTPATTYYFCAIAQNSVATSFGAVLTFTTPSPPTTTTTAATSVTNTSASLNGSGNPNGSSTTGYFRYSTTDPGACDDLFGSRAPVSGGSSLGTGTSAITFTQSVTGLSSGATYYYCAIANSFEGTTFGAVLSFTTPGVPTTTTVSATLVTSSTATLNGSANPNGNSAFGFYRYSTVNPGVCDNVFGTRAPTSTASDTSLGAGSIDVAFSRAITGLSPATTYYYCALARNTYGTTNGVLMSFTTLANAPTVTTSAATLLTGTTAQLNGSANPGGDTTTGWFRYHTASPGTCNDSFGTRAPLAGGSALGAGSSSVTYLQGITGLTPATTYYFCAIAQNSVATSFGAVLSFTTPSPPTVTTTAATSVTNTTASLNGSANPNGSSTTGYFRYAATDPGTCDDIFGSRAPVSGGSSLGTGTSAVTFTQALTGLSAGTTYYFCAIATSFEGLSFGAVLSFTTPTVPTTTTVSATLVTSSTVTLNGSANPNGNAAFGFFRYSTTNPGVCDNVFGTRAPTSTASDTSLGAGSLDVPFSRAVTGLTPATTYYYCALGRNTYGTTNGVLMSFTTLANAPSMTTSAATLLTGTTAQLNGSGNPGGDTTTAWFRYATASPGTCNDSFGTRAPAAGGSALGAGNASVTYFQGVTGLLPATTYYFCAIGSNSVATSFGAVLTFTTPSPPTAVTTAATSITNTTASLNGSGNPNGSSTTGYFRYSTTDPGACDDLFGSRAPVSGGSSLGAGTSSVTFTQAVTGLSAGATYYFCAITSSFEGISFGAVLSFTTPNVPTTTTVSATVVTSTSVTLNGSANPNGNAAFGFFRYSTVSPGVCDNVFGTRAPTSSASDTSLGSGSTDVAFARSITGLTPATTYFYCALGRNTYGTTNGVLMSFTTLANAPTVTTSAATLLTGTTAQLNGSANPGGGTTTGWFRYSTTSPGTCNDSFGTRAPAASGAALGAGTSSVTYLQGITGLSSATTYYFCAIASNSVATAFGAVLSFVTPSPPTVTTTAATSVTNTSASLNGSANPNGSATTGYFRYAASDPGVCDDLFGSRAPVSGGSSLGTGSSAVTFTQSITGLSAGTTYYFCAIAASSEGTAFGALLTFTTPTTPTTTTSAATLVTSSTATMNGSANPNNNAAFGFYRYSTTNPGVCDNVFGTRAPTSSASDTSLGAGNVDVPFARALTGLTPATTYYYCALARNTYGTTFGTVMSFTTLATAPSVTTTAATSVSTTTATLNASANPNGSDTTGWFRYDTASPGTCNDSFGTRAPTSGGSALGAGTSSTTFFQTVTGLSPGTLYYFCAIAQNAVGTTFGAVLSFTATAPPSATTLAATPVTATTATLNGLVNPNGYSTTGWFRYSTSDPGACDTSFGTITSTTSHGSGTASVALSAALTSLSPATTYYFCAIAQSSIGTTLGQVLSFTTPAAPPSVVVQAATNVTNNSASLNATATPNGSASTGWFRYSTVNPGACNDSFGTRAPTVSGTNVGAGNTAVPFFEPIAGLATGTTYYFCAIVSSGVGTSFSAVLSFATVAAPAVTTSAATLVSSTTATLNGSANPNLSTATGWFRYSSTNPGTCDDTFGTRAPAASGSALGAGSSAVAYAQAITGLTSGTTYYYCAIAQNGGGTGFGSVLSFTTTAAPSVTTSAATLVAGTTATLNGSANPNLGTATGWFRYSSTNPGTCTDVFGTRAPTSGGTSLGAGGAAVAYSQAVTGLTAGTTYYFCAIASNAAGTGFGAVLSFTTPGAPAVTTVGASSVAATSATLDGSANPNLGTATGWFRYSATNPGTCNDVFGTRSPASGGAALGAGSSAVAYSQAITGLTAGTTYYYCAIASNAVGTGFGAVMSLTTPATPTVVTSAASAVGSGVATLNGSANPNLGSATGWFRYDTVSPGTCNDVFGTRAPASGGTSLGAGAVSVPYAQAVSGLAVGTTYFFCAIADNATGKGFGAVLSFTTPSTPTVTTAAATLVSSTTATLNGSANPNLSTATGWFRYSSTNPGTCDDTFGTRAPGASGSALGAGSSAVTYAQAITGLISGTTYYFCAIADNAVGTGFGAVLSFTTTAAPSVTTSAATLVTATTATLNGSANPNLSTATGWFRYSATDPGSCNDVFGTRAPAASGTALGAGGASVAYAQAVTGLSAGTTYYFCAIASNAAGTGFGAVLSFTTPGAPVVTTVGASSVAATSATLDGSANPNLSAATGYFRYATVNPGTCNDVFGTRAPSSGGASLGAGSSVVTYSQAIAGLSPATTYYYCAIASNAVGTGFGAVMSLTTLAAPTVVTSAASGVASNAATLNGSANPNLAAATGWFRYATTDPGTCDDVFGTRAPASGGTSLGAGSASVPYAQAVSGLTAGTTYYFCAIADNTTGTGFGAVLSFTTPAAPTVTTDVAVSVTSSTALLQGAANPNLSAATGWFRYDTTDPGACDDTFGVRAPAASGTALGSGSTPVAFMEPLALLLPGTTYYYCAIADNAVGTGFGAVLSFTTSTDPSVTTLDATALATTGATLNGSANPNLGDATGWFRYDVTDPGTCDDTFGTRAPTTGGTALGAGSASVDFFEVLTGLSPGTTYYFCAIASNNAGTAFGEVLSFVTPADPPIITTLPPTNVDVDAAVLNGSGDPNGTPTTGWFRYDTVDPGACDDTFGVRAPDLTSFDLGTGFGAVAFSEVLSGLTPAVTYYYCAIGANGQGLAFGQVLSFVTGAVPPTVTTEEATDVQVTEATIAGTANPNGSDATGWFRYGTTDPGSCDDAFGSRAPAEDGLALGAGTAATPFSLTLSELEPKQTYYYCAAASNEAGAVFGEVLSFTTGAAPPIVETVGADLSGFGSIKFHGTSNPNGSDATGWFALDELKPEACNDDMRFRVPSTGGTDVGAGRAPVAYTESLTVQPGTYYYCAISSNEAGTSYGEVLSLVVPEVSTPGGGEPTEDAGCGCRVGTSPGSKGGAASLLVLALLAVRRRRRRA